MYLIPQLTILTNQIRGRRTEVVQLPDFFDNNNNNNNDDDGEEKNVG